MKAMRARFGKAVKSGRKTLKLPKGKIPADADLVVTLSHKEGIGFYLPDERRWVVSYPEQHHQRGTKKERATSNRFKRTIRMFKAARNQLKLPKGKIPADADLVVTLSHKEGIGFYLPDERRWVVSYGITSEAKKERHAIGYSRRPTTGQHAGTHQRGRSLLLHRVSALQCSRRSLRTGAGADVRRHPDLAEDREAQ